MAAIETVHTATATNTLADDESINPDISNPGAEVHITLVFDNPSTAVDVNDDIYDMVNDKFATVATDKVPARGTYIFRISA
jgi:hypothetical protein